jgi:signal transduction histidine kinase/ligand-binding sensor domain-containing protein/DNA-binding response OmpR family regulator
MLADFMLNFIVKGLENFLILIKMKIILLLFGYLISTTCFAQRKFEKITTSEGLSLNIIKCIVADSEGFLYFGSSNGLNIYDGTSIKILNRSNNDGFGKVVTSIIPISDFKILIGTLDSGLFIYDKSLQKLQKVQIQLESGFIDISIVSMYDDNSGNIWIGTLTKGLFSIEIKSILDLNTKLQVLSKQYPGIENVEINSICSSKEKIWIGTKDKGLFYILKKELFNKRVLSSTIPLSSQNIWDVKVFDDILYIGTEMGLNIHSLKTQKNTLLLKEPKDPKLAYNIIRAVTKDNSGTIWVGTQEDGLYSVKFINDKTTINHFKNIPTNSSTLNINKILSLYTDKHDNLWIGTWAGGVNILNNRAQEYANIRNKGKENDLSENMIWSIAPKESGNFLLGTHGSGICQYNIEDFYFSETTDSKELNSVSTIYFDETKRTLWAGTWGHGLKAFRYPEMIPLYENILKGSSLKNDFIYAINKDAHGIIWVGSYIGGVYSVSLKDGVSSVKDSNILNQFKIEKGIEKADIKAIIADKNNVLWIGSLSLGLFKATTDASGNIKKIAKVNLEDKQSTRSDNIICLFLDDKENLWIGENNGTIKYYNTKSGLLKTVLLLEDTVLSAICEDNLGNIWISTYNGLLQLNPESGSLQKILENESFSTVYFDSKNKQILAGSNKGVYSFYPSKLKMNPIYPKILFSKLKLANKLINPSDQLNNSTILKKDINYTDTIILPYNNNTFSMDVTAMSFTEQNKSHIYYQLENYENIWNQRRGSATSVDYSNLSPGSYIFKTKVANKDAVWNPEIRKLNIVILPPWWRTNWAYMVYFVIIFGIGYTIFYLIRNRVRAVNELKIEKIKKEQNDLLNEQKLSFFTNISHEIRTPLTLILGPLENIIDSQKKDSLIYRQLDMMKKNTELLLQLVNQLLDFRKIENNKIKLKVTNINLNAYIIQTLEQFKGKTNQKNISLQFLAKSQSIELWADNDLLQKIIFNLLSNAIRFTKPNGKIIVSIEENSEFIHLIIKDNGKGITKNDLPNIFKRFYQSPDNIEGGSGLGLSLVKKMIALHKATIHVKSKPEKGSTFSIDFLKGKAHFNDDDIIISNPQLIIKVLANEIVENETASFSKEKSTLIIIDDNEDIRKYIRDSLVNDFNIIDFDNATEALASAKKKDISLILCDIMMPVMDGYEFCKLIKSDIETSHIPVILVTAKTADESKIEGYEKGADDYVSKPFNMKLLKIRIHNLIEQREKLKKRIKKLNIEPSMISPTSLDEQFLKKAISLIEENISNNDYSIDDLSSNMRLSSDNFYRKIKNLSGLSATQFITIIKLKRAAQLLDNSDYSISEILYAVGFSSPSYFAKCFKKQYGISPSQYQNKTT